VDDHVFLSAAFQKRWAGDDTLWILATQPVPGVREAISDHDGILVELWRRWTQNHLAENRRCG